MLRRPQLSSRGGVKRTTLTWARPNSVPIVYPQSHERGIQPVGLTPETAALKRRREPSRGDTFGEWCRSVTSKVGRSDTATSRHLGGSPPGSNETASPPTATSGTQTNMVRCAGNRGAVLAHSLHRPLLIDADLRRVVEAGARADGGHTVGGAPEPHGDSRRRNRGDEGLPGAERLTSVTTNPDVQRKHDRIPQLGRCALRNCRGSSGAPA